VEVYLHVFLTSAALPTREGPLYSCDMRMSGHHSQSRRNGEEKIKFPCPCGEFITAHPVRSLITILTELPQFHDNDDNNGLGTSHIIRKVLQSEN
jgi:hypothetical protein